jgi:hypothetical protein
MQAFLGLPASAESFQQTRSSRRRSRLRTILSLSENPANFNPIFGHSPHEKGHVLSSSAARYQTLKTVPGSYQDQS